MHDKTPKLILHIDLKVYMDCGILFYSSHLLTNGNILNNICSGLAKNNTIFLSKPENIIILYSVKRNCLGKPAADYAILLETYFNKICALFRLVASGTLCTSQILRRALISGSCGCAFNGSRKNIT